MAKEIKNKDLLKKLMIAGGCTGLSDVLFPIFMKFSEHYSGERKVGKFDLHNDSSWTTTFNSKEFKLTCVRKKINLYVKISSPDYVSGFPRMERFSIGLEDLPSEVLSFFDMEIEKAFQDKVDALYQKEQDRIRQGIAEKLLESLRIP